MTLSVCNDSPPLSLAVPPPGHVGVRLHVQYAAQARTMQACTACGAILVGDLLKDTQGLIRGSKGLPLDANLARVPIRDILHKELQVSRNNGCDLVKISVFPLNGSR